MTDDIAMSAIRTSGISPATAAVRALKAGCDMVMTSDPDIRSIVRAIMHEAVNNQDFHNRLDEAVLRILILKFEAGLIGDQLYTENTSRQLHNTNSEFLKKTGDAILRSGGF